MIRHSALKIAALVVAFAIVPSACSGNDPLVPQFTSPYSGPVTGTIIVLEDPSIVDIMVMSCGTNQIPENFFTLDAWQTDGGANSFQLEVGCYDIRVRRITAEGFVSRDQRVVINGGEVYVLAV